MVYYSMFNKPLMEFVCNKGKDRISLRGKDSMSIPKKVLSKQQNYINSAISCCKICIYF